MRQKRVTSYAIIALGKRLNQKVESESLNQNGWNKTFESKATLSDLIPGSQIRNRSVLAISECLSVILHDSQWELKRERILTLLMQSLQRLRGDMITPTVADLLG